MNKGLLLAVLLVPAVSDAALLAYYTDHQFTEFGIGGEVLAHGNGTSTIVVDTNSHKFVGFFVQSLELDFSVSWNGEQDPWTMTEHWPGFWIGGVIVDVAGGGAIDLFIELNNVPATNHPVEHLDLSTESDLLITLANGRRFRDGLSPGSMSTNTIPEPSTIALLGLGLAAFGLKRRKS